MYVVRELVKWPAVGVDGGERLRRAAHDETVDLAERESWCRALREARRAGEPLSTYAEGLGLSPVELSILAAVLIGVDE